LAATVDPAPSVTFPGGDDAPPISDSSALSPDEVDGPPASPVPHLSMPMNNGSDDDDHSASMGSRAVVVDVSSAEDNSNKDSGDEDEGPPASIFSHSSIPANSDTEDNQSASALSYLSLPANHGNDSDEGPPASILSHSSIPANSDVEDNHGNDSDDPDPAPLFSPFASAMPIPPFDGDDDKDGDYHPSSASSASSEEDEGTDEDELDEACQKAVTAGQKYLEKHPNLRKAATKLFTKTARDVKLKPLKRVAWFIVFLYMKSKTLPLEWNMNTRLPYAQKEMKKRLGLILKAINPTWRLKGGYDKLYILHFDPHQIKMSTSGFVALSVTLAKAKLIN